MMNSIINPKCASSRDDERKSVTFNIIPSNRTDVDYFSITNSQNDEVIEVKPTERSFTTVLEPGMVTFSVTTTVNHDTTACKRIFHD